MAELKLVPVDSIVPHPDNPRVQLREDVVSAIAANLDGEFPQKHALHVRAIGDDFQVLSGHHRLEAAKRAGVAAVWCWVDDLDDDAAFMELVTSNNQGELDATEMGTHVFMACPTSQGKKGGLQEYADRVGKSRPYISQIRSAGEVLCKLRKSTYEVDYSRFFGRAQHLAAIHKLPRKCWQSACEWLAENEASVADVEKKVAQVSQFADTLREWDTTTFRGETDERYDVYEGLINGSDAAAAVFCGREPGSFIRLCDLALKVYDSLPEDLAAEWRDWLHANAGGDSWDIHKCQAKRIELENIVWERENAEAEQVASEAVTLILADPPWQYDFAETDNRKIENHYPSATVEEICSHINAAWVPEIADDCVLFLWATAPKLREALRVMDAWGFTYKTHAVWDKEKIGMGYWFRGQHELLLVGTRGNASPPEQERRISSVFREARGKHSAKPECVYAAIEAMFPDATKAEFYQRTPRDGWSPAGLTEAREIASASA